MPPARPYEADCQADDQEADGGDQVLGRVGG